MTASIWGLTTYFNPAGYRSKAAHFHRFAASLRRQGLPLALVELRRPGAPPELGPHAADLVLDLESDTVLWHKERLLNLGLAALPDSCDKLVWLDADLLFERDDWVEQTAAELDRHPIVQPFSRACWLPPGTASAAGLEFAPGLGTGQFMPAMARVMAKKADRRKALESYFTHGHTGFAWAARRSVMEATGWFDALILGGGDTAMARAMYSPDAVEDVPLSAALATALQRWREGFHAHVQGRVGFVEGRVLHLWHGEVEGRRYVERGRILVEHDFDPARDIGLDERGLWRWTSDKPLLHAAVAGYFGGRREDG